MDGIMRTLERQVGSDPAAVEAFVRALARAGEEDTLRAVAGGYAFGEARGWSSATNRAARRAAGQELTTLRLARGENVWTREFSMYGPCLGGERILRETAKFYVVVEDRATQPKPRKIAKDKVHTVPCRSCRDHAETQYPRGYEN